MAPGTPVLVCQSVQQFSSDWDILNGHETYILAECWCLLTLTFHLAPPWACVTFFAFSSKNKLFDGFSLSSTFHKNSFFHKGWIRAKLFKKNNNKKTQIYCDYFVRYWNAVWVKILVWMVIFTFHFDWKQYRKSLWCDFLLGPVTNNFSLSSGKYDL